MPDQTNWLNMFNSHVFYTAAAVAVVLILMGLWISRMRRRGRPAAASQPDLRIDVEQLTRATPLDAGPRLEFYGTPVRLAALVLAPSGRQSEIPPMDQILGALDDLLPGLAAVVQQQKPLIRFWPPQLSTQGFTNAFFQHVRLPGNRGKGTPWCSAAGRFETDQKQLLAGLVCEAEKPNSLSQITIEHTGQWMDVLRAKNL